MGSNLGVHIPGPSKTSKPAYTGVLNILVDVTFQMVPVNPIGSVRDYGKPGGSVRKYQAKAGKLVIENGLITRVVVDDPTPIALS